MPKVQLPNIVNGTGYGSSVVGSSPLPTISAATTFSMGAGMPPYGGGIDHTVIPTLFHPDAGSALRDIGRVPPRAESGAVVVAPNTAGALPQIWIWNSAGKDALEAGAQVAGVLDRYFADDAGNDYPLVRVYLPAVTIDRPGEAKRYLAWFDERLYETWYATGKTGTTVNRPPVIEVRMGETVYQRCPLHRKGACYFRLAADGTPQERLIVGPDDYRPREVAGKLIGGPFPPALMLRGTRQIAFYYLFILGLVAQKISVPLAALRDERFKTKPMDDAALEQAWRLIHKHLGPVAQAAGIALPPIPMAASSQASMTPTVTMAAAAETLARELPPRIANHIAAWQAACERAGGPRQQQPDIYRPETSTGAPDWARDFFLWFFSRQHLHLQTLARKTKPLIIRMIAEKTRKGGQDAARVSFDAEAQRQIQTIYTYVAETAQQLSTARIRELCAFPEFATIIDALAIHAVARAFAALDPSDTKTPAQLIERFVDGPSAAAFRSATRIPAHSRLLQHFRSTLAEWLTRAVWLLKNAAPAERTKSARKLCEEITAYQLPMT